MNRAESPRRTLRVFVPRWVIDDGSFPRASLGDTVDVLLEFAATGEFPSPTDETVDAIARPAYGREPVEHPAGTLRWLHLVHGDGWSSGWWSDRPRTGSVRLTGTFVAGLGFSFAVDEPNRVRGRVRRLHLVEQRFKQVGRTSHLIARSEQLTEINITPGKFFSETIDSDAEVYVAPTGILVELDLDDVPGEPETFIPGAVTACDDVGWVMHRSDPILLRIDTAVTPPQIVEFAMPLTIEPPDDLWTRRVHGDPHGCWVVGDHDIHRCDYADDGTVTVERYCTEGGTSVLHEGNVYLLGRPEAGLYSNRRYGVVDRQADHHPLRVLDNMSRRLEPVTDAPTVQKVLALAGRADRATTTDGTRWMIDSTRAIVEKPDGTKQPITLSEHVAGIVRWAPRLTSEWESEG
ncbi:hypothetical protein [Rhodococcus sp. OK302]|uniref:hypothetical protein n=1 Tax=Rhodococcus sp. OK302 TaxID=1882769 RepID=UPI000B9449DF|nr:hypothetical protein [Rhodococcus sp. OK302]OYD69909.1 hypothetical protein BDB13_3493 [Rhodococcus sp. OK302]